MILDSVATANLTQTLDFLAMTLREAQGQDVDNAPGLRGRLINALDGLSRNLADFEPHARKAGLIPEERDPDVEPAPEVDNVAEEEPTLEPADVPTPTAAPHVDIGGMQTADGVGLT